MKRILFICLVFVLAIALIACDQDAANGLENESSTSSSQKTSVTETTLSSAEIETSASTVKQGYRAGDRAIDFTLNDLNGNPVQLSDFAGKTVVLNFWATWCDPCRIETPHLNEAYIDLKDQDVEVIAVNMTFSSPEEREEVPAFVDEYDVSFNVLLDEEGSVADSYKIRGIPTNVFINSEGIIEEVVPGMLNKDAFVEKINSVKGN